MQLTEINVAIDLISHGIACGRQASASLSCECLCLSGVSAEKEL
jgi:hypothetical protein